MTKKELLNKYDYVGDTDIIWSGDIDIENGYFNVSNTLDDAYYEYVEIRYGLDYDTITNIYHLLSYDEIENDFETSNTYYDLSQYEDNDEIE